MSSDGSWPNSALGQPGQALAGAIGHFRLRIQPVRVDRVPEYIVEAARRQNRRMRLALRCSDVCEAK